MRRSVLVPVVVCALLCLPALAAAQKAIDITPYYVAGIQLGMTQAKASSFLTKPIRTDRLEDGYVRLVSPRQKVEAYFRTGTKGVAAVGDLEPAAPDRRAGRAVLDRRGAQAGVRVEARPLPAWAAAECVAYRLGNLSSRLPTGSASASSRSGAVRRRSTSR